MKTFFLVRNDLKNKFLENKYIVEKIDRKKEIIDMLKIKNINPEKYVFFDESELFKENKFFDKYMESILTVYFPLSWDAKSNGYVYYPKPDVVTTKNKTTYVNRWENFESPTINNLETIRYISDDSDKEEHRRVMILQYNGK